MKDRLKVYKEEIHKLKKECNFVSRLATEGDATVRQQIGSKTATKKHTEVRVESEGGLKNTVYIKDVESLILTDNEADEKAPTTHNPKLAELVRGTDLLKSVATVRMPAADQINSMFVAMANQKRMRTMKQTEAAAKDDIYRIFFENMETHRSVPGHLIYSRS